MAITAGIPCKLRDFIKSNQSFDRDLSDVSVAIVIIFERKIFEEIGQFVRKLFMGKLCIFYFQFID